MEIVLGILFFLCFLLILFTQPVEYLGFVISIFILNAFAHWVFQYRWLPAFAVITAPMVVDAIRTVIWLVIRPLSKPKEVSK